MNNDLMQKLMVAKKIMDAADQKPRGNASPSVLSAPMVESFNSMPATYNIPQEILGEQKVETPVSSGPVTKDKILNSRLPDEIKKLMIEHPIEQPKQFNNASALTDEMVEKAARLMHTDAKGNIKQPIKKQAVQESSSVDMSSLKQVIRETIEEVLSENGLMVESTQKAKEQISFKVGQHIFEGTVTRIKKIK